MYCIGSSPRLWIWHTNVLVLSVSLISNLLCRVLYTHVSMREKNTFWSSPGILPFLFEREYRRENIITASIGVPGAEILDI